ncbi:MAG: FtsK/SpoIIIE domain-containing protein [Peptococcaceae bacterium]|nr:FtsK/SpoIIIE domain-containing protein [Peptococcaceae bacterium]
MISLLTNSKYQQYYREGAVHEPLQHLVLIADEFAELKDQQPEFLDQLVSAARIGRSLGIHLILATQKPAGVVNDQIWSNSRFRICLKVQDKADSQDMLKRPDAAELTDTGRFYLQVGYNEIFDLGQSAWSGANYFPADRYTPEKDDAVVVIDRNGRPLRAIKPDTKKNPTPAKSQLDAVTVYLSHIAAKEHIHARLLWLEPIAPVIFLDEVKKRYVNAATTSSTAPNYVLNPIIGEYDDPARQRQGALTLPLTAEGNTIIYGAAGSGKTTFLNAVIYSLLQEHTAADLNLYLLDFSAETLRAFAQAPQVGDIVFSYESEKVANLIKMLQAELLKRKKTFADCRNEPADMPNIVVVIHDFAVFIDLYEDKTRDLMNLTRECSKYRIYFILTALNVNTVRTVLRQNFKQLFTLQLNDPSDYHSVVGKTDTLFPAKYKGRGLVRLDDLYEFQIAFITEDPVPYNTIYAFCQTISHLQGASAPKIPVMPETIDVEYFADHIIAYQRSGHPTALTTPLTQMTMPIGIDCDTYQPYQYPFGKNPLTLVISTQEEIRPFLSELTRLTTGYHKISTIVFDPAGPATSATSTAPQSSPDLSCATTPQGCETAIAKISLFLENRLNGQSALQSSPLVLIISAYSALWNILSEESRRQLTHILERGAPSHNILVVLGEPATDIGKTMHMPWFRTRFPGTPQDCIWIGRGMKEQYAIEVTNRPTTTEQATLPPGYAFSVINGKATKIKLLGAGTQDAKGTATP